MILNFLRKLIPDVRNQVVRWALKGVAEHADFDYLEVRPLPFDWKPRIKCDCSFFVNLVYYMAGARSPMGQFDGYGNSDTLFQRGKHILQKQLHKGDVITFGAGGSIHAVIVVQVAPDPLCASMGKQGDPSLVRLSVLEGLGAPTFLRFSTINRRLRPSRKTH